MHIYNFIYMCLVFILINRAYLYQSVSVGVSMCVCIYTTYIYMVCIRVIGRYWK
jgi:hypothetical protein